MILAWTIWTLLTVVWNCLNSANSRAKNSASAPYNFVTTLLVSAFYIASIMLVGNALLEAKNSGQFHLVMVAVGLYAMSSAVGSTIGQVWARKFERKHHIEKG